MSVPALLLITMALHAGVAMSDEGHGDTCGPFELTTTSGTLYSAPNGTQLPGDTETQLEVGRYLISDDGTLKTHNGALCLFRPYLQCRSDNTHSERDGAFSIGEFGRLSYSNNDTFHGCNRIVGGALVLGDMRIVPAGRAPGNDSGVALCNSLAMQASRCHPGENDTNTITDADSSTSDNATGESNGANSTEDGTSASGTSGIMTGLGTALYSIFLVLGLVLL